MATRESRQSASFLQNTSMRTVLSQGTDISGKLVFDLPVKIDSRFKGEVKASDLLVVGANAEVEARISARELQIEGSVVGKVRVSGLIEILPGGRLQGEIEAARLRVHAGGFFKGKIEISLP